MGTRIREAPRRSPFAQAECGHVACVEQAHLDHLARFDGDMAIRLSALAFLSMLTAIRQGVYGGVSTENLFD